MGTSTGSQVAVIGAGITGLSVAYHLASRGVEDVAVYERLRIGAEASGVQPGGVRQQWGTEINCRMGRESLSFYRRINDHLEPRVTTKLESCGYIFLAESLDVLNQLRQNVELQNSLEIPSRLLSPDEASEVVSDLNGDSLVGAAFCQEDGYFDRPQSVVEAFADASIRCGASITYADIVAIERHAESWKLEAADGSQTWADQVVVAAGYGTPALLSSLGVRLPISKEPRYLFYSEPISDRLLEPLVISPERQFATKQLENGRLLASDLAASGSPEDGRDTWRKRIKTHTNELLPRLEFVSLSILVEGFYDMTPDGQPVIGPIEGHEGLWVAAGFSGHGFMMAPVVGDRLARALLDGARGEELDILSPSRFEEDRLVPEPQVF